MRVKYTIVFLCMFSLTFILFNCPYLRIPSMNRYCIAGKIDETSCISRDVIPDIILLNETWCNDQITDMLIKILGYELQTDLRRDREDTRNGIGGGLLVYAKTGGNILILDNAVDFNQYRYCTFGVVERREELQVYLLYRSPNAPED